MTCNLLRKELLLTAHPTFYVFLFMGALVLVPGYPFGMVFFFGCLALFFTTQFARENHDVYYSAVLPLSKREAVRGRCMLFGVFQLAQQSRVFMHNIRFSFVLSRQAVRLPCSQSLG